MEFKKTNKNDYLISVIVPIYNAEKYMNRCLDSIIEQEYADLEIILVDDGSKDNSGVICDKYAKKDNRIKVIHKNNGGVSSARNCGVEAATGEYIAFIDADDYIEKEYLTILMNNALKYNADISCCDCIEIWDGVATDRFRNCSATEIRNKYEQYVIDYLDKKLFYGYAVWGKIIRSDLAKKNKFLTTLKIGEDTVYMFNIFKENVRTVLCEYKGYYYVRNDESATLSGGNVNPQEKLQRIKIAEVLYENANLCSGTIKIRVCNDYAYKIYTALSELIKKGDKSMYMDNVDYLKGHINIIFKEKHIKLKFRILIGIYRYCPLLYWDVMGAMLRIKEVIRR